MISLVETNGFIKAIDDTGIVCISEFNKTTNNNDNKFLYPNDVKDFKEFCNKRYNISGINIFYE
jgi:hypothetical protein